MFGEVLKGRSKREEVGQLAEGGGLHEKNFAEGTRMLAFFVENVASILTSFCKM